MCLTQSRIMAKRGLDKVNDFEDVSEATRAVLCLSHSWALSEQSELLCCWHAGLLLSQLYFVFHHLNIFCSTHHTCMIMSLTLRCSATKATYPSYAAWKLNLSIQTSLPWDYVPGILNLSQLACLNCWQFEMQEKVSGTVSRMILQHINITVIITNFMMRLLNHMIRIAIYYTTV